MSLVLLGLNRLARVEKSLERRVRKAPRKMSIS